MTFLEDAMSQSCVLDGVVAQVRQTRHKRYVKRDVCIRKETCLYAKRRPKKRVHTKKRYVYMRRDLSKSPFLEDGMSRGCMIWSRRYAR